MREPRRADALNLDQANTRACWPQPTPPSNGPNRRDHPRSGDHAPLTPLIGQADVAEAVTTSSVGCVAHRGFHQIYYPSESSS